MTQIDENPRWDSASPTPKRVARKYSVAMTLPLTGRAVVHRIITELAVIDVTPEGLTVVELAPGISLREVQERTEPALRPA